MKRANEKEVVRLELTKDQREQVKRVTGRDSVAIQMSVEELEERIAPGWTNNNNETMLAER